MTQRPSHLRLLAVSLFTALSVAVPAWAAKYAVVINAENTAAKNVADPRSYVKTLYLKQQTAWPDGTSAALLARRSESPIHQAFMAEVLQMSQEEVDDHWLRMKQTQGETPPREVGSALILYRFVTREVGSVSVISADELETAPIEVEVMFEFEH